jgi:hypothetical protein
VFSSESAGRLLEPAEVGPVMQRRSTVPVMLPSSVALVLASVAP